MGKWVFRLFGSVAVLTIVGTSSPVRALTDEQMSIYKRGVYAYDASEGTSCGVAAVVSTGNSTGATTGSWDSGLQPPYILEQFAIETLKDVAKKKGVNQDVAVTEEHVIALIAFMWGEGGDINNINLFNPLNSGLNAPELLGSPANGSGHQSFRSFDAGVEATARTMVGTYQSRLAATLTIPTTTAEQFMEALTYYRRYEGNKYWAAISDPSYNGNDGLPPLGPNAPDIYYRQRLVLVQQTRARYADMAGTVIGTLPKEQPNKITAKEKLTFHPSTDNSQMTNNPSTSAGGDGCISPNTSNTGTAQAIAQTAVQLSWPEKQANPLIPKPEYSAALRQFNPGKIDSPVYNFGADCGTFVGTVMHASGADKDYPGASTAAQLSYVRQHPEKYELSELTDTTQLRVGDVLIIDTGASGHTWIYVGPQGQKNFSRADASQGERMPNLGNAFVSDGRGKYTIARFITSTNPNPTSSTPGGGQ